MPTGSSWAPDAVPVSSVLTAGCGRWLLVFFGHPPPGAPVSRVWQVWMTLAMAQVVWLVVAQVVDMWPVITSGYPAAKELCLQQKADSLGACTLAILVQISVFSLVYVLSATTVMGIRWALYRRCCAIGDRALVQARGQILRELLPFLGFALLLMALLTYFWMGGETDETTGEKVVSFSYFLQALFSLVQPVVFVFMVQLASYAYRVKFTMFLRECRTSTHDEILDRYLGLSHELKRTAAALQAGFVSLALTLFLVCLQYFMILTLPYALALDKQSRNTWCVFVLFVVISVGTCLVAVLRVNQCDTDAVGQYLLAHAASTSFNASERYYLLQDLKRIQTGFAIFGWEPDVRSVLAIGAALSPAVLEVITT